MNSSYATASIALFVIAMVCIIASNFMSGMLKNIVFVAGILCLVANLFLRRAAMRRADEEKKKAEEQK